MSQILVCALAGAMLYQRAAIWCRRGFWNAFLSTVENAGTRTCRRMRNVSPRCTYIACCKKLLQILFVFFLNYQRILLFFIKYNPPLSISVGCVVCSLLSYKSVRCLRAGHALYGLYPIFYLFVFAVFFCFSPCFFLIFLNRILENKLRMTYLSLVLFIY
jgi:hypothetical protein